LEILKEHRCRSVIRMTLAKGLNMVRPEDYARVIERAEPDFVEVKAYMHLGRSRARLEREAMPQHHEILNYARTLAGELGYNLEAEVPLSRVALLSSRRLPRSLDL
jgi:tRNA wybutosine-synthesizing protein 1